MNTIDLDNLSQEDIAKFIAYRAHAGQFRNDGVTPFITHPEAVVNSFLKEAVYERAIAWLHDVLEDNPRFDENSLYALGIEQTVVDAVCFLTKSRDTLYDDYIDMMIRFNSLAVRVKIYDIRHNLSCTPKEKTKVRYIEALKRLEAAITGKA